jgi:hypothetical protein
LEILLFANTWAVFALALCGVMGKGGIDITLLWKWSFGATDWMIGGYVE